MTTPAVENTGLPSDAPKPTQAAAPIPGSPEYNAAMAAKMDATNSTPAPVVATRPEGVPEKFWDAEKGAVRTEDLLKSYAELEKTRKQGAPTPADPAATPAVPTPDPSNPDAAAATEALASKGLDMAAFSTEFQANGALSEDSYKALETAGIPKSLVDTFIEGQKSLNEARDNAGYEVAGGKENFAKMATWAATNLSVAERVAFNEAAAGNVEQSKLAIMGLRAQYEAANGKAPTLVGGSVANGASGYESKAEMLADMKDPRYAKDPAFRNKVMMKMAISPNI